MSELPRVCGEHGLHLEATTCPECDGYGFRGHDCGEDTCACADPHENVECDCCGGAGMVSVCPACYERETA